MKITLEFEDINKDGHTAVSCTARVEPGRDDVEGVVTDAYICGIAVKRLWDSQSILHLCKAVTPDLIRARQQAMAELQQMAADTALKASQAAAPETAPKTTAAAETAVAEATPGS